MLYNLMAAASYDRKLEIAKCLDSDIILLPGAQEKAGADDVRKLRVGKYLSYSWGHRPRLRYSNKSAGVSIFFGPRFQPGHIVRFGVPPRQLAGRAGSLEFEASPSTSWPLLPMSRRSGSLVERRLSTASCLGYSKRYKRHPLGACRCSGSTLMTTSIPSPPRGTAWGGTFLCSPEAQLRGHIHKRNSWLRCRRD